MTAREWAPGQGAFPPPQNGFARKSHQGRRASVDTTDEFAYTVTKSSLALFAKRALYNELQSRSQTHRRFLRERT